MTGFLLIAFCLLFPIFLIVLSARFPAIDKIGIAILCYLAGIAIAPLLPEEAAGIQEIIFGVSIPLALPLLLFSANLRLWSRLAGKTFLSLAIVFVSVLTMTTIGYLALGDFHKESWKVAGMIIGVYTGGSINLNSIGAALQTDSNLLILTNTSDMLICLPYFLFILSIGQRTFQYLLPRFKSSTDASTQSGQMPQGTESIENINDYSGFLKTELLKPLGLTFCLALIIFAIGMGGFTLWRRKNTIWLY